MLYNLGLKCILENKKYIYTFNIFKFKIKIKIIFILLIFKI
jgi:hypothetical protein